MKRGFTLIEIIIVIIVVGILAAVGLSQYSLTVEKSRVAEAKVRVGAMSKLAYEYYLNNGTFLNITDTDVGVDNTCHSTDYYLYYQGNSTATSVLLCGIRCASGGKSPRGPAYRLCWQLSSGGSLSQYAYMNEGGAWVNSSDWGPCCR